LSTAFKSSKTLCEILYSTELSTEVSGTVIETDPGPDYPDVLRKKRDSSYSRAKEPQVMQLVMLTLLQKSRQKLAVETTVLITVVHECHKLMPYSFAKLNAKFDTVLQFNHLLCPTSLAETLLQ
jgi:hypothetical protein